MKDEIFLVATSAGIARMTKRWPALARNEIGVRLKITVPDGAFRSPILTANIEVAEQAIIQPSVDCEVTTPEEIGE